LPLLQVLLRLLPELLLQLPVLRLLQVLRLCPAGHNQPVSLLPYQVQGWNLKFFFSSVFYLPI
jgi:hypothetical protein